MSMSSEGSITTVAADINAGGSWISVENTLSDTSQTLEFAESEQGYHSDGTMSDSETDFSAKVSDFEAQGESNSHSSDTSETDLDLIELESKHEGKPKESGSELGGLSPVSPASEGWQGSVRKSLTADSKSLFQAVQNGNLSLINHFMKDRSNLSTTDSNRRTALHVACSLGHLETVKILLAAGSNVDSRSAIGQTALHEACKGGHYDVVQELLSKVSDLDSVDSNGLSAAHFCCLNGEIECLTLLCDHGCDICLEDKLRRSGVHLAALRDHADIIRCLVDRGMELDTVDHSGKTPAHYAARSGSAGCLKILFPLFGEGSGHKTNALSVEGLGTSYRLHRNEARACAFVFLCYRGNK